MSDEELDSWLERLQGSIADLQTAHRRGPPSAQSLQTLALVLAKEREVKDELERRRKEADEHSKSMAEANKLLELLGVGPPATTEASRGRPAKKEPKAKVAATTIKKEAGPAKESATVRTSSRRRAPSPASTDVERSGVRKSLKAGILPPGASKEVHDPVRPLPGERPPMQWAEC